MSKILVRVAQIVGVLVLAGIAVSVVVGLVQWLLGAAVIVAIPLGAWWLYTRVSGRNPHPTAVPGMPKGVTGSSGDRRSELEPRRAGRGGLLRLVRIGNPAQGRVRLSHDAAGLPPRRDRRNALTPARQNGPHG
jgi:hypothetical protein